MRYLHITNGDGAAGVLKASQVSGDILSWRDPMHHGPFPADLSLDELRPIRAKYLVGPDGDPREAERDFRLRDDHLRAAPKYDCVILWFEHDLLDQVQILQVLDWFATAKMANTDLQLICIDRFDGIDTFRGIGQLTPVQMASLFDQRSAVTDDMLACAQAGWRAFRSSDPNDLLGFIDSDMLGLPFLKPALLRHLEEFPSARNGLSRTEQQVLTLVSEGVQGPVDLFLENMEFETALYIGNWSTYSIINRLCGAGLLACAPDSFQYPPLTHGDHAAFRDQTLTLTPAGERVRLAQANAGEFLARDQWLGGVALTAGHPAWTWDADTASFVQPAA